MRKILIALLLLLPSIALAGDNNFPTPGNAQVQGVLPLELNSSGSAQPFAQRSSITASATGTTAAVAATLTGAAGKTTYICGFNIGADATAAVSGTATVAGTISGTMNFLQEAGAGAAVAVTSQTFSPCIPASATNTAITVTSIAAGTGGATSVSAWGYQF